MILLSASESVRKSFRITPVETSPVVNSRDWYRFWRVDARRMHGRGKVMLFTNHETLYTFVADARLFRTGPDLAHHFLGRFTEVFAGHFGYGHDIKEDIVFHRAPDRSAVAVMNNFFLDMEYYDPSESIRDLEERLNATPIVSRKLFPDTCLREKLAEHRRGHS
jgi:hypothetical protein